VDSIQKGTGVNKNSNERIEVRLNFFGHKDND